MTDKLPNLFLPIIESFNFGTRQRRIVRLLGYLNKLSLIELNDVES
jgi:hypothetical protein